MTKRRIPPALAPICRTAWVMTYRQWSALCALLREEGQWLRRDSLGSDGARMMRELCREVIGLDGIETRWHEERGSGRPVRSQTHYRLTPAGKLRALAVVAATLGY